MIPTGILETVLYAKDLVAAEAFYRDALGMEPFTRVAGRHLFYRCGDQVLLIFNPDATRVPPARDALPVPPHGMDGEVMSVSAPRPPRSMLGGPRWRRKASP
jgi:catechol 2,3-dioxygenase-like lactoylglutathione lyase family enzyme